MALFEIRNKDLIKSIQFVNSSNSVSDSYFFCLLDLACITTAAKLYTVKQGLPSRSSFAANSLESKTSKKYWEQWDKGLYTAEYLGYLCRKYKFDATSSLLWELVSDTFKCRYLTTYERRRQVTVMPHDFEGICKAIANKNKLVIGEYSFLPRDIVESIDDYGLDVYYWRWKCFKNRLFIMDLHCDSYEIARNIFSIFNKQPPEKLSQDNYAIGLEFFGSVFLN
jgi:hypothetical protein